MATIEGNGIVVFGDGTSLSSANVAWGNIYAKPTTLSNYTNDLGNYGGFLDSTAISTTQNCGNRFGIVWYLSWTGTQIQLLQQNCNCNCNC